MKFGLCLRWFVLWFFVVSLGVGVGPQLVAQATTYFGVTFPHGDIAFADRVVQYVPASCVRAAYARPEAALGPPDATCGGCYACDGCDTNAVSLGYRLSDLDTRGFLVLEFVDNVLIDGPGDDLFIYNTTRKPARVYISQDGGSFLFVGEVVGYPGGIDIGPYVEPNEEYRFVRISDVPADEDKSDCSGPSIDAVGAMGQARVQEPEMVFVGEAFGSLSLLPVGDLAFSFDRSERTVLVLLDRSSSMRQRIAGGEVKMDAAKEVMLELIDELARDRLLGIRTFGGMCVTELVAPVGTQDLDELRDAVLAIEPTGFTPIAIALDNAKTDLAGAEEPYLVLLISDGEETCAGDPVHVAQELVDLGFDLMIHVVGFDVSGGDGRARDQLIEIAESSGGLYFSADSTEDLRQALGLREGAPIPYAVYDEEDELVYSGTLGDAGQQLASGIYTIVIDTPSGQIVLPNVLVREEQETRIQLERSNGEYQAEIGG